MSFDIRFQEQPDQWDNIVGWIVYTLHQLRPGDVFEMGPRAQMVYPETDGGVPCAQAQLLRDNVVWLRISDRPLLLPNVFDLDADRIELEVWRYDGLPEDCTAGEFFSANHGHLAEAIVAWFRDRQQLSDPAFLGCEFHRSPYREPLLGEPGNTDSVSSVVRRIENLAFDSELSVRSCLLTVGSPKHSVDIQFDLGDDQLFISEATFCGAVHSWPDADELLEELNEQLSTIQCAEHHDGFNVTIDASVGLASITSEQLKDLVVRVDSARDLICGEYGYNTYDPEVQAILNWRDKHGLACYEAQEGDDES